MAVQLLTSNDQSYVKLIVYVYRCRLFNKPSIQNTKCLSILCTHDFNEVIICLLVQAHKNSFVTQRRISMQRERARINKQSRKIFRASSWSHGDTSRFSEREVYTRGLRTTCHRCEQMYACIMYSNCDIPPFACARALGTGANKNSTSFSMRNGRSTGHISTDYRLHGLWILHDYTFERMIDCSKWHLILQIKI